MQINLQFTNIYREIGFTDQALVKGCMDNGLSPASVGMFGKGPYDLVDYAMEKWYDQLKVELDELDLSKLGLKDRLKIGIKTRLSYQIPYHNHWNSAMALGLHPYYFPNTLFRIHKITDHLWYVIGDDSVDINWYTKRAALSSVYSSTELYMVQDNSDNFNDTWEFLDDRLCNIIAAGKFSETVQNTALGFSKGLVSMATAFIPNESFTKQAYEFVKAQNATKEYYQSESTDESDNKGIEINISSETNGKEANGQHKSDNAQSPKK